MPVSLALVPGSFDPVTNGHIDIIARSASLFEQVRVVVAENGSKAPLFSLEERIEMLEEVCSGFTNVQVHSFEGLLVQYAQLHRATVIVKGLRAVSDFEYELQMALMNRRLAEHVETMFLMTGADYSYLSSNIVKEIARLGGAGEGLVPKNVEKRLRETLA